MMRILSLLAALLSRLRAVLTAPAPEKTPVSRHATGRQEANVAGDDDIVDPWVTPDGQPIERFSPWK